MFIFGMVFEENKQKPFFFYARLLDVVQKCMLKSVKMKKGGNEMKIKKYLCAAAAALMCLGTLAGCGSGNASDENSVVIYSSDEVYINEYFQKRLNEQFPDYNITIEYLPTGENAARLKAEGTDSPCDIVWGLEVGYLDNLTNNLADVSQYDKSIYVDDMKIGADKYLVAHRYSGCVAVNTELLKEKNLEVPKSYEDLLKKNIRI